MNVEDINNVTEDPAPQYAKDIYMCLSVAELTNVIESTYSELAADALEVVKEMDAECFKVFR